MPVFFKRAAQPAASERLCAPRCCSVNELRACHMCVYLCVFETRIMLSKLEAGSVCECHCTLLTKMDLWKLNDM